MSGYGYGAPPGGAPGYGPPPGGAPAYGAAPGQYGAPGYGAPPGGAPGYTAPGGYGAPPGAGYPDAEISGPALGVGGAEPTGYPGGPTGGPYPTFNDGPGAPVGYPDSGVDDRGLGTFAIAAGVGGAVAYGMHHHSQQQEQEEQHGSHHGQALAAGVVAGGVGAAAFGAYQHHQHQEQPASPSSHGAQAAAVAGGVAGGVAPLAFFNHMSSHQNRNYVLIVDRSASMGGARWRQAEDAVCAIAPHICNFDPDGITLYLFDHEHKQFDSVRDANQVKQIFQANGPRGTTDLARVLEDAFKEHFQNFHRTRRPTTILVVTDGAPDNKDQVAHEVLQATQRMESDPELSVSFIQVGDDYGADRYLKELDDKIPGCRFDIVDTLKASDMKQKSFAEMVALSVND